LRRGLVGWIGGRGVTTWYPTGRVRTSVGTAERARGYRFWLSRWVASASPPALHVPKRVRLGHAQLRRRRRTARTGCSARRPLAFSTLKATTAFVRRRVVTTTFSAPLTRVTRPSTDAITRLEPVRRRRRTVTRISIRAFNVWRTTTARPPRPRHGRSATPHRERACSALATSNVRTPRRLCSATVMKAATAPPGCARPVRLRSARHALEVPTTGNLAPRVPIALALAPVRARAQGHASGDRRPAPPAPAMRTAGQEANARAYVSWDPRPALRAAPMRTAGREVHAGAAVSFGAPACNAITTVVATTESSATAGRRVRTTNAPRAPRRFVRSALMGRTT
jgi:hypothetical protein